MVPGLSESSQRVPGLSALKITVGKSKDGHATETDPEGDGKNC